MLKRPVLYPRAYMAYVALAAVDVLLTSLILSLGGDELNKLAAWVFSEGGITGATFFKFATVVLVLLVCEIAGRHNDGGLGRGLVRWAVIISLAPVLVGAIELCRSYEWVVWAV